MANWGESFGNAFTQSLDTGMKINQEKWKTEKELPEKLATQRKNALETMKLEVEQGIKSAPEAMAEFVAIYGNGGVVAPTPQQVASTLNPSQGATLKQGFNEYQAGGQIGMRPKELNIFGQPTGYEYDPVQENLAKKQSEAQLANQQLVPAIKANVREFRNAISEISKNNPEALKEGFSGGIARLGIKFGSSEWIDKYPAVAVLMDNIKADATEFAKARGEQRPTDSDIERFLSTLLDPTRRSLPTNIKKAESMMLRWKEKGINVDWAEPFLAEMRDVQSGGSLESINSELADIDAQLAKLGGNK